LISTFYRKFRSTLAHLGGADAVVLHSNCLRSTSQGPYVVARVWLEPATFQGARHQTHHWVTRPHKSRVVRSQTPGWARRNVCMQ